MNTLCKLLVTCWLLVSFLFSGMGIVSGQNEAGKTFEIKSTTTVMKISSNGGRIVSFRCGSIEMLTQSSEHENFGSTFWTAPQSDWGWPPLAILDEKEYKVENLGDLLKMTSKPDPKSGFQIEKTWKLNANQSIQIEYLIRNISGSPKSVGPWEVTRVPCGGFAFYPSGGEGKVPESSLKPDLQTEEINWVSIDKNPIHENLKLYSTAKEGWLAYVFNGFLFVKQFPDTKPENYSPHQGEVEIYADKNKGYVELENQGAYQLLQPGESLLYAENWFLISIPEPIKVKPGNLILSELVRHQLGIRKQSQD